MRVILQCIVLAWLKPSICEQGLVRTLDLNMPFFTIPFCNQVKSSFLNHLDIGSYLLPFVLYDSLNPVPVGIRIRDFTVPY